MPTIITPIPVAKLAFCVIPGNAKITGFCILAIFACGMHFIIPFTIFLFPVTVSTCTSLTVFMRKIVFIRLITIRLITVSIPAAGPAEMICFAAAFRYISLEKHIF